LGDDGNNQLYGMGYDKDGNVVKDQFQIGQGTDNYAPKLASLGTDGNFVVLYTRDSNLDVQEFSGFSTLGFNINVTSDEATHSIAALCTSGSVVVAWSSAAESGKV